MFNIKVSLNVQLEITIQVSLLTNIQQFWSFPLLLCLADNVRYDALTTLRPVLCSLTGDTHPSRLRQPLVLTSVPNLPSSSRHDIYPPCGQEMRSDYDSYIPAEEPPQSRRSRSTSPQTSQGRGGGQT